MTSVAANGGGDLYVASVFHSNLCKIMAAVSQYTVPSLYLDMVLCRYIKLMFISAYSVVCDFAVTGLQ